MVPETHRTRHVKEYCVRVLNRDVFAHVRFLDKTERDIVYDSYIQNIDSLIEYAAVNGLNLDLYFREIKNILLKSANVREYTR